MRHRKIILRWTFASIKIAYRLLATNAESLCRHSFGERYRPNLLASFGLFTVYVYCLKTVEPTSFPFIGTFFGINGALLAYHFISISRRRYVRTHSRSAGSSWHFWLRFGLGPTFVHIVAEPAVIFSAGTLISLWDEALATWLQCAALCLGIRETIAAWHHRRHVLDAIDTRIESERMSESIRQRTTPRGMREQTVNPVTPGTPEPPTPRTVEGMLANLDPALRDLFRRNDADTGRDQGRPRPPVPPSAPRRNRRPS
jgi:hypothetical protein